MDLYCFRISEFFYINSSVKRARDETRKLETESRKMEERLAELRLAMNKEKEERE